MEPGGEDNVLQRVRDHLLTLRKRKWTILVVTLLVVAAAMLYTREQVPIYRATAAVIIDRAPPQVLSGVKEVIELGSTNYWAIKDYLRTQYEIIRSREVAEKVVDRLGLLHNDHRIASVGTPSFEPPPGEDRPAGLDPVDAVLGKIRVEPLPDSLMVYVHAEDSDPEFAMDLANTVAEAYRDYNLETKKRIVIEAQSDLDKMVERLRVDKDKAEQDVSGFELEHNIGSFENQKRMVDQRIADFSARLNDVGLRRIALESKLAQLNGQKTSGRSVFSVAYADVIENPLVLALKQRHTELSDRLSELEVTYLEKHPRVKALKKQVRRLEGEIRREVTSILRAVDTEYQEVLGTETGIRRVLEEAKAAERELNRVKVAYEPLLNRHEEAAKFYNDVLHRQEETVLSAQSTMNNVRIHDLAVQPTKPVRPNWKLAAAVALLLGLACGIGVAFLREFLDTTIKDREDIEDRIGLSFLGVIPPMGAKEGRGYGNRYTKYAGRYGDDSDEKEEVIHPALYIHYRKKSVVAERTRNVRTNLLFMLPDKPLQAVLVTSANPEEGKTTISVNVAISMAQGGSRTVLVDTDLRRPRVHAAFGVKNTKGVTSAVMANDPIEAHVTPSEVPNLDLLLCGPIPPDPTALLHTERFREMMGELREKYDVLILDSPPVLPVTDALIIANQVDGVLTVVKSGKTAKDSLALAKHELLQVNARILGAVLNDHDVARKGYGHYKYYRYRYYRSDSKEARDGLSETS